MPFVFLTVQAFAQSNSTATWLTYSGNHRIGSKYNVFNDIQCRSADVFSHISQYSYRIGVGYFLRPNQNISLNYMVADAKSFDEDYFVKSTSEEKRIFEQYQYKAQKKNNSFTHRIRLEQRYFTNAPNTNRIRYYLGYQRSLFKKQFSPKSVYLTNYDEIYFNLQNNLYDRFRFSSGFGYFINPNLRLECTYMLQFLPTLTNRQVVVNFINGVAFKK